LFCRNRQRRYLFERRRIYVSRQMSGEVVQQ
jgi:hypothetical protein